MEQKSTDLGSQEGEDKMLVIRQSMISDYEVCPYMCMKIWGKFGEPDPPFRESDELTNKYAMCGTALHTVMDEWAKAVKGTAKYPLEHAQERLVELITAIPDEVFEEDTTDGLTKDDWFEKMRDQLEWIWDIYTTAPPLFSELNFHIENLIPGLPPIEGTMDRIDGNLRTQDINLYDYKTGKQYTKKELSRNVQATLYSLAFEYMFGFRPKNFIFIFSKTKREKVIPITQEFIDRGLERIKGVWYKVLQEDFTIPNKPNKFYCQNFCPVYDGCPKWSKASPEGWEGVDRL